MSQRGAGVRTPGGKAFQRRLLFERARGVLVPGVFPRTAAAAGQGLSAVSRRSARLRSEAYAQAALGLTAEEEAAAAAPGMPRWRSLGPVVIPGGQPDATHFGDVSGRIAAVAIDPSDRKHILVGSAGGGVWESRNRGRTWSPRTDFAATLTVGALAFDPTDPTRVYCGTGEGNFYSWLGVGVLTSENGGTTWRQLASGPFAGQGFFDLIVDPANGRRLLAATTGGVYSSANGGKTWILRRSARTWDLSMAPAGGPRAEIFAASADGLHRSTNGTAYTKVNLPGQPALFDRLAVAHAPSNPQVVWAFGARRNTTYVWRRTSPGHWTTLPFPPDADTSQSSWDWLVAASPDRDTQVYAGQKELFRGDLVGGGWVWTNLSFNPPDGGLHPDQHAVAFEPGRPSVIYVGNDGGLYRSTNRGKTWTTLNEGLAITEIEYLAQKPPTAEWLLAGTQDNGTIRYTGSSIWEQVAGGDGGDCAVNQARPNIVFHSFYDMGMERSRASGDEGTFESIGPDVPDKYKALFYPPLEANGPTIAQAGQSVFASRNNGTAWKEIALPSGKASAMSIPSANTILAGNDQGRIWRLTWSNGTWSAPQALARPQSGGSGYVSDLFADPADPSRIWATFTSGGGTVFRSDNGGDSWTDLSAGLPSLPVNAVAVDPQDANRVWVAADLGVFQSRDAGATWQSFSLRLPNVLVIDLVFHPGERVLRTGTRNRGVWEIDVGP
jgi:photosystem II stability/assembly factor-like uncharacterized protein